MSLPYHKYHEDSSNFKETPLKEFNYQNKTYKDAGCCESEWSRTPPEIRRWQLKKFSAPTVRIQSATLNNITKRFGPLRLLASPSDKTLGTPPRKLLHLASSTPLKTAYLSPVKILYRISVTPLINRLTCQSERWHSTPLACHLSLAIRVKQQRSDAQGTQSKSKLR